MQQLLCCGQHESLSVASSSGLALARQCSVEVSIIMRVPCGLQVRQIVVACPAVLAEKPLELQRKVDFLKQVGGLAPARGVWLGEVVV